MSFRIGTRWTPSDDAQRLTNRIHGVLHANLIRPYRGDLFSGWERSGLGVRPVEEERSGMLARL